MWKSLNEKKIIIIVIIVVIVEMTVVAVLNKLIVSGGKDHYLEGNYSIMSILAVSCLMFFNLTQHSWQTNTL